LPELQDLFNCPALLLRKLDKPVLEEVRSISVGLAGGRIYFLQMKG